MRKEAHMKKKPTSADLSESFSLQEAMAGSKIDEAAGVIKDVVLMTADKVSHNKTKYTRKALQEALKRYDGAKMYLDHPRKDELAARKGVRSVRDLGGTYRNLYIQEGPTPTLKGDLHLLEHNREIALSIAKNPPKDTGLSLRDRGTVHDEQGVTLVEGFIGDEFSIDLVVNSSLNKSLFESTQINEGGDDMAIDWKEISLEDLKENRKDLVESIQNDATAPLKKLLEESGVKTQESEKLMALVESKMSAEFKEVLKPALLAKAITLEEAKKMIVAQEGLFTKLSKDSKGDQDPSIKGQKNRDQNLSESAIKDEDFLAAFSGK